MSSRSHRLLMATLAPLLLVPATARPQAALPEPIGIDALTRLVDRMNDAFNDDRPGRASAISRSSSSSFSPSSSPFRVHAVRESADLSGVVVVEPVAVPARDVQAVLAEADG